MNENLSSIIKEIIKFRDDRDWLQFHDPKNLSQAISIEAAELQEIFLWKSTEESKNLTPEKFQKVQDEIADIFVFMVCLPSCRRSLYRQTNFSFLKVSYKHGIRHLPEEASN